jgi:phosphate:Na+ symporter
MARVLTYDLSWLSPLFIFIGVTLYLSRKQNRVGQIGHTLIGLGLILLALHLIVEAAQPITHAAGVQVLFSSLTGDIILDALVGAMFAMISYSSLAAVLITATLTATDVISLKVALCLVIGANVGSGILAMLNSSSANTEGKRVALGSLLFKVIGAMIVLPLVNSLANYLSTFSASGSDLVISFHVFYNLIRCAILLPFTDWMAGLCQRWIKSTPTESESLKLRYLDRAALDTPSLALVNAARETLRMGDIVEQMMESLNRVFQAQAGEEKKITRLDDDVDALYTGIKLYLAQIPKDNLQEEESDRWAEIFNMAVNLEQAGDVLETMAVDITAKSLATHRHFSAQGIEELQTLYESLLANLQLSLSVFISRDQSAARRLRRAKHRFRMLNQRYSLAHVDRLHLQNVQSLETSSLHLELLGEMKRLNSLFCSVAYSVLEQSTQEDE